LAGVTNVSTIKQERDGVSVGALGGGGAYGTAGTATIKDNDFSMVMAGKYLKQADWQTPYTFQNGANTFSVSHTIPSNAAGTYIGAQYKNLTVTATADQSASSYFIPPFQVVGDERWRQFFADVGYVLTVRPGWTMNVNVTYNQSLFNVTSGTFPNITRNSREILGEWTSFVTLSEKSKIVIGGTMADTRGRESTLDTPVVVVSDGARESYSGYLQADYQLASSVKVIGGFQANKIGASDVTVVPRAGLIWAVAPKIAVKALYGQAYRAPYINELNINHPGLLGNPNLQPEHVSSVDLEVSYSGANIELVAKYFDNRQTESIIEVLLAGETRPHYENAGIANIKGVEFSGKHYVSKAMYLTGSLLYQTSNDGNGHDNIAYGANVGAKAGFSYSTNAGTISLFDTYQGDVADRLHQTLNQQPGPYQMLALHGSLNMNKALSLKRTPEIALILQGDNLMNEQLWVSALGNPATETVPFNKGRATYLGIKVGF
jgi:outer membrane cobalamin receptor